MISDGLVHGIVLGRSWFPLTQFSTASELAGSAVSRGFLVRITGGEFEEVVINMKARLMGTGWARLHSFRKSLGDLASCCWVSFSRDVCLTGKNISLEYTLLLSCISPWLDLYITTIKHYQPSLINHWASFTSNQYEYIWSSPYWKAQLSEDITIFTQRWCTAWWLGWRASQPCDWALRSQWRSSHIMCFCMSSEWSSIVNTAINHGWVI